MAYFESHVLLDNCPRRSPSWELSPGWMWWWLPAEKGDDAQSETTPVRGTHLRAVNLCSPLPIFLTERRTWLLCALPGHKRATHVWDPPEWLWLCWPWRELEREQSPRNWTGLGDLYQIHHPRRGCFQGEEATCAPSECVREAAGVLGVCVEGRRRHETMEALLEQLQEVCVWMHVRNSCLLSHLR